MDIEGLALVHQLVEHFDGIIPVDPDFVAQVAGVAGARNVHGNAGNFAVGHAEIFERGNVGVRHGVQQFAGGGTLQRESRSFLGNVLNLHIQAKGVLPEPAQAGIGGGPAVVVFAEARDGAVVNDLAVGIAPAAVNDLIDGHLVDVAGDDTIDEFAGVAAVDAVFEERCDVDQSRGVADGVVLVLVRHFVDAGGVIARPLLEVEAFAERESSFVKSGSDGHIPSVAVARELEENLAEAAGLTSDYSFEFMAAASARQRENSSDSLVRRAGSQ